MSYVLHTHIGAIPSSKKANSQWNVIVVASLIGGALSLIGGAKIADNYVTEKAGKDTLKGLIFEGESGSRGYNSYNRGSMRCAKSNRKNINLTGMTVDQIKRYQSMPVCTHEKLLAVGHYQIVPDTLTYCNRVVGISGSTAFTPQVQDKIFALCLAGEKRPAIRRWVREGVGIKVAAHAVANEWKIFKSPYTGRGTADGVGNNKARISALRVLSALQNARIDYLKLIDTGIDPDTAYATALGAQI